MIAMGVRGSLAIALVKQARLVFKFGDSLTWSRHLIACWSWQFYRCANSRGIGMVSFNGHECCRYCRVMHLGLISSYQDLCGQTSQTYIPWMYTLGVCTINSESVIQTDPYAHINMELPISQTTVTCYIVVVHHDDVTSNSSLWNW